METFSFYQDRKVTCWERTRFEVTAENYEEAVPLSSRGKVRTYSALRTTRKSSLRTEKHYMKPPNTYP